MSCLDYDTQKWIMVSFASVAITLIIGLVLMQYAHGQTTNENEPKGVFKSKAFTVKDLKAVKSPYGVNTYDIQGTIKNISNESITGITITAEAYNATNAENGITNNLQCETMEPDEECSFSITAYPFNGPLDHYIITMSSDR